MPSQLAGSAPYLEKDWESPYLTMPHWPTLLFDGREGTPLSRTLELLEKLGNPQDRLPPVVHVAGTNGKGSTIAFLRSMLEAAGLAVHVYTSPHLHRFNERIVLAGRDIDDATLFTAIEAARHAANGQSYSFFEGTTAAAMYAFAHAKADVLLMETGCGGRFDPTNVVKRPALTIITTISYDHTEILGQSLAEIAWHKAGIMRADTPCVISFQAPEAGEVLARELAQAGAPDCSYGTHWRVQRTTEGLLYTTADGVVAFPPPCLPGPHQYVNAGNAIAAATILDFPLHEAHVRQGLQHARWPARLERIASGARAELLPEGWELWVDGGHNVAAGHTLASHIETDWRDKPTYVVFGTTQGKDVVGLLAPLAGKVEHIFVTPVASEPKSYSDQALMRILAPLGFPVRPAESIEDAIGQMVKSLPGPARILVFGSLYLRVLVA